MIEVKKWAALDNGHAMDFRWERNPVCPHCRHVCSVHDEEWWHLYDEGEHDVECPICEHAFVVSTSVEYRFCTDEQEREE